MNRPTTPSIQLVEWQNLVNEASQKAGYHCDQNIEHYLVLTLDHFTTANNLSTVVIATDFLLALEKLGRHGGGELRKVGDECLLLAGLFPERVQRKQVSIEYFIGIGQEAYHILSHASYKLVYDSQLFNTLSKEFPHLIDVLHTMREIGKSPLH